MTTDQALTRDEVIARNLAAVEAHFHNETPENVAKAVALYTDDIVWEGPGRGLVLHNANDALAGYHDIFNSLKITKHTQLRRFATEDYVFDDCIYEGECVGTSMQNLPLEVGEKFRMRLAHVFEMRDGKIAKEIAYEIFRRKGSATDNDYIPPDAPVTIFE